MSMTEAGLKNFVGRGYSAESAADKAIAAHNVKSSSKPSSERNTDKVQRLSAPAGSSSLPEGHANPAGRLPGEGNAAPEAAGAVAGTAAIRPKSLSATPFLCRSEVRNFLLEFAARTRAHRYSRVSEETLRDINEAVRNVMMAKVRSMPSKGKTI